MPHLGAGVFLFPSSLVRHECILIGMPFTLLRAFARASHALHYHHARQQTLADAMTLVLRRTALFVAIVMAWALLAAAVAHSATVIASSLHRLV